MPEMDSKEKLALEREASQVVNFTNIDSEPFDAMYGGIVEVIDKGETVQLTRAMAKHYTKHLVNKILIREGTSWTSKQDREPLERECLGEVEVEPDEEEAPKKEAKEEKEEEKAEKGKDENKDEEFAEKPEDEKEGEPKEPEDEKPEDKPAKKKPAKKAKKKK